MRGIWERLTFSDDIFKHIFSDKNVGISIQISIKSVTKGTMKNTPEFVQIMAWRRTAPSHYLNQWWLCLLTLICVARLRGFEYAQIRSMENKLENYDKTANIIFTKLVFRRWWWRRKRRRRRSRICFFGFCRPVLDIDHCDTATHIKYSKITTFCMSNAKITTRISFKIKIVNYRYLFKSTTNWHACSHINLPEKHWHWSKEAKISQPCRCWGRNILGI